MEKRRGEESFFPRLQSTDICIGYCFKVSPSILARSLIRDEGLSRIFDAKYRRGIAYPNRE